MASAFLLWFGSKDPMIPVQANRPLKKHLKQLQKALKLHHQNENSQGEAKAHEEMGMLLFREKFYDAARDRWKDALRIYQETNDRPSMAELYSNIGTAYRHEHNLREAARFYNKALLLDRDFNKGQGELYSLHNLGSVWMELSEYENALDAYAEALDIARDHRLIEWESDTLYRLGFTYRHLFRHMESFRFFESGLKCAESIQNLPLMTLNVFGLGSVYEDIGEYSQSLLCYEDALNGAVSLEDAVLQTEIMTRTAALRLHIGFLDEAREISRVADELIPRDTASYVRIELDLLRSDIYYARGMKEKSVVLVKSALNTAEMLPNRRGLIHARLRQAVMEIDQGQFSNAMEIMQSLERSGDSQLNKVTDVERLMVLGRIFMGLEKADDELKVRETAAIKADETRIPRLIWQTRSQLGRVFLNDQKFQLARNEFERADAVVSRTAMSLDPAARRVFIDHRDRHALYGDYILLLLKMGHKEQADRIMKRVDSDILRKKLAHFLHD
ncbi:tetratricopeptide repeat protein [bacterium]|nr:tetratricopeptide repeat protein [candidate division CSSED10-310 bacterium]